MKITRVSARNFKGFDFDQTLAAVNIITGDNFSGKTAIPTAIQLGLTGSLPPPIGTKGIYRLAGNPDAAGRMEIHLELDGGRKVDWAWTRSAQGKISCEGSVASDLVMPPFLCEPKSFFAQTGAERIGTIFNSCPGAGVNLLTRIKERLPEVQVMPTKVRDEVFQDVLQILFSDETHSPQYACMATLDWSKTEIKDANKAVSDASAQMQAIRLPVGKPADVSAELESARNELAKLNVGADVDKAAKTWELASVNTQLDAYSRKYKDWPVDKLMAFVQDQIKTVDADLAKLRPPPPMDDTLEEMEEAHIRNSEASNILNTCTAIEGNLLMQHGELSIATECPTCQSSVTGWKNRALNSIQLELDAAKAASKEAMIKLDAAESHVKNLFTLIESGKKSAQDYAQTKARLNEERRGFETDAQNIDDLIQQRDALNLFLAGLQEPDAGLLAMATSLQEKIGILQGFAQDRSAYESQYAKRDQLESALVTAQARADTLKAVNKIVLEEQQKATETAFGSVLTTARHFTDGLLNSPLEFVDGDLGRRVSQQDRTRKGFVAPVGGWISHETFSDSEQRIAYAAFGVALAVEAPVKIVIIDEMGTLSQNRKVLFVDRLLQLTRKGIIDQAICLEPGATDYNNLSGGREIKLIAL